MKRILLVDDSATDRTLLKGLLSRGTAFEVSCAANGHEALEHLAETGANVVITDMRMPEMDGLELVEAIRGSYPMVPVVLITGHGSEGLAAKALKRGAAGYVPKSHCGELLCATVLNVLRLADATDNHDRLIATNTHCLFEFDIPNDVDLIPPLQDLAQRMVGSMELCDATSCLQIGVALQHAVLNAIFHGNLEFNRDDLVALRKEGTDLSDFLRSHAQSNRFRDRRVKISMDITRERAEFVVEDEGSGFDIQDATSVGMTRSLSGDGGQGLILMWAFMDHVRFNREGNRVTLIKERDVPEGPAEAAAGADEEAAEGTALRQREAVADPPGTVYGELTSREGHHFQLTKKRVAIGRDVSSDIVINHPVVSVHHCVLYVYQGWWFVKDLDSKNGVKVNHKPTKEHLLRPGCTLSIGSIDFELSYELEALGAIGITPPENPF